LSNPAENPFKSQRAN